MKSILISISNLIGKKKTIELILFILSEFSQSSSKSDIEVYVIDDCLDKIAKRNEELLKEIKELKNPKKKEISTEEIKRMSYWEFSKWKRG